MATVYVLTEYGYSSYSYSGIEESERHIHSTREGAESHAKALGLVIVQHCERPGKHAEIDAQELLP